MPRRGGGVGPVVPEPVSSPGRRTTRKGVLPLVLNGRKSLITVLASAAARRLRGMIPAGSAQAQPSITTCSTGSTGCTTPPNRPRSGTTRSTCSSKQMRGDVKALRADQASPEAAHREGTSARRRLHRPAVRGRLAVRGRPGRRLQRPERVRLAADHDVGVQHDAGGPVLLLPHPGQGAEHPSGRHPGPARQGRALEKAGRPGQGDDRARTSAEAKERARQAARPTSARAHARGLARAARRSRPPTSGLRSRRGRGALRDGPDRQALRVRRRRARAPTTARA